MSRILRTLVCLLLICCILVNLSPLNARALDPVTVGFVGVSAVVGVACIMQALGYMAASNSEPFTNSVNSCVNYLTESTSFVINGMLTFAGCRNGQLSSMYAMRDLVQEVWQWLFDSKAVFISDFAPGNTSFTLKNGTSISPESKSFYRPVYGFFNGNAFYADCVISSGRYYYSGGSRKTLPYSFWNGDTQYFFYWQSYSVPTSVIPADTALLGDVSGVYSGGNQGQCAAMKLLLLLGGGLLGTTSDVTLGQIQSPYQTVGTDAEIIEIEFAPVYIDLTKEIQEFPDPNNPSDDPDLDKKIPWLPIRIPSKNYDDTVINQTQQESWTGESEVEFEFDYGDSSGDGSGNTGTDSGSTGNTGSTWKPPSDPTHFKLVDLSKFFPFCIPFDLFDFFKLLNADPVAPSFTWEIQDLSGQTYGLTVDLSQWDSVAQLFRRLQLFLFVCGLAAASRKYIKW